jgi:hypothetical protein
LIRDLGLAEYRWFLKSFTPVSDSCGEYTATVSLVLEDTSILLMDEIGFACSPGHSFSSYPPISYGQPTAASGSWDVIGGTGQFEGVTAGSGTDILKVTGADFRATYAGTLQD